ncbi:CrcB family protein [Planomonospora sp. ID82291]|uniref:FluC/FEX family fluoride channel n=1 Tax=Planomonospora sp. ID82291 TaxID=2738136 RepID=UPI0018C3E248|nr:CrcB family protein [Planomonospora sp. ID82291]MBG0816295.1 CrcB family protein [Planomonospora sp. ID82291]
MSGAQDRPGRRPPARSRLRSRLPPRSRPRAPSGRPARPGPPRLVTAAVACGGALGALARHGLGAALPTAPGAFPWTTLAVNLLGCLLIGALVVVLAALEPHPLAGPFLSTGVLGGFTTFSSFAVDTEALIRLGRPATALSYLLATPVLAVAAAFTGTVLARRARWVRRARRERGAG